MIFPEYPELTLSFVLAEGFRAETADDSFRAAYAGGELALSFRYDADPRPLSLSAKALPGDGIDLFLTSFRIALSVNGRVRDEEWPFGAPLFAGRELSSSHPLSFSPGVPAEEEAPAVTGSFYGAEGWKPGDGVFVGDCMPYAEKDRYHVLYLKDRRHHKSKWGRGAHQWEHISTRDLKVWETHPMVVAIDDASEGSICTGSHLEKDGISYLFYTVRSVDGSPAPVRRSLSRDGTHFGKDRDFSFTISSAYNAARARDPKVFRGEDGLYHMLLTTTFLAEGKGCLLHLVSPDLDKWREVGPLYLAPGADEPECPDLFTFGEFTYLVFSLRGVGQYRFTKTPLADWTVPADPVIPCRTVPKAAAFHDKILFAGFESEGGYAGHMTFRAAVPGPDGVLRFLPDSGVARHEPR
ncbi:MAG: hypothetical protein IKX85_06095 [Clostridia bacterium]|nr:hypothetical protein [Clostridia bacterium]